MGLFSKKNIDKAKELAEKNAAKIAQGVDKATDAVNKKTGGKYASHLAKVDETAHKFARQPDTPDTPDTPAATGMVEEPAAETDGKTETA